MLKNNHFVKTIALKEGAFVLQCYTGKENYQQIREIVCEGNKTLTCAWKKISEDEAGINYQVTLPAALDTNYKFFILLTDNTKIRTWKPWENLTASTIPGHFYFTYHHFNLAYSPDSQQIVEKVILNAKTLPVLTKIKFKENKACLSGILLIPSRSNAASEKALLRIVKYRDEANQYSFDIVTRPVGDQQKAQFKKFAYMEFWQQKVLEFSCEIDLESLKHEKGFFKLFIEHNGYLLDIKNINKSFGAKDHYHAIKLPLLRKVLFVPYCDDLVNTWRLDIYRFNLLERLRFRQLTRKISEGPVAEKDSNTWLIGEYQNTARDNGMHFFKYLKKMHPTIDAYYVIYSDSPDKKNVKRKHVVSYGSYRHFALAAKAKVLVFSHAANFLVPKIDKLTTYKNKYEAYHTIFIQHGVIATTALPLIYRKKIREFDRFVVSSSFEQEIIHKHLGYDKKDIIITGLSRWDELLRISRKSTDILIMPTWRNDLNNISREAFVRSDYFKFWNSLLSNDAFLELVRNKGITVKFFLHFALSRFADCFDLPPEIKQANGNNIQALLGSCGLLVTDYSSVAFDVLLQDKPVIFTPFDYADMVTLRKSEPFIDFEKDLPGPVCYNVDSTVRNIINHVENGYTIAPEYADRRDKFFEFVDNHNSDRIFMEIKKLISSGSAKTHHG